MLLSIICAMDEQDVIGINNQLPWYLPADLQHFKRITWGKSIIMGRKTFESIGKVLPGRQNIIITSQRNYHVTDAIVCHSLSDAIKQIENEQEVFVIGGGELFKEALPLAGKMYLTVIHHCFKGNVFFPPWNKQEWKLIASEKHEPDEKNVYPYTFLIFTRSQDT